MKMKAGERVEKLLPHLPLLAAIFSFAVACVHFNSGVELVDEGVLNMGAWRISEGQVPYRDFFVPYTPFSFYYLAFFFKLLGVSVLTGRLAAVLLSLALSAVMLRLCVKTIKDPLFASFPIFMTAQAGMSMWHFASHHWIGNLFTILSMLLLMAGNEDQKKLNFFLSGLAAAMAFVTINDQGLYILLFFFVSVFFFAPKASRWRAIASYSSGASLVLLAFLAYFLIKAGPGTMFYDLVVFPFTAYKGIEGNRMGVLYPFRELVLVWTSGIWREAPLYNFVATATSLLIALLPLMSVLAAIYIFAACRVEKFARALIISGALAMILTASRRFAPINLMWAAALPSVLVAAALSEAHLKTGRVTRRALTSFAVAASLLFVCFGIMRSATALNRYRNIEIPSKAGTLRLAKPDYASSLNGLLNAISEIVPEDETFLSRNIALVNFLCLKKNPSRIDFFNPPIYTPEKQMAEVITDLDGKTVRFLVSLSTPLEEENPFDKYLMDKFTLRWHNDRFAIYKRNQKGGQE